VFKVFTAILFIALIFPTMNWRTRWWTSCRVAKYFGLEDRHVQIAVSKSYQLDPVRMTDPSSEAIAPLLYHNLYVFSSRWKTYTPDLAWGLPRIDSSGKIYQISLRPRIIFSDGSQVTAATVVESLNRLGADPDSKYKEIWKNWVERIRSINQDEIEITLKQPTAFFISLLASPCAAIVKSADGKIIGGGRYVANAITGGLEPINPRRAQVELIPKSEMENSRRTGPEELTELLEGRIRPESIGQSEVSRLVESLLL
jgi:ABC-type transport system substrate-binding protein